MKTGRIVYVPQSVDISGEMFLIQQWIESSHILYLSRRSSAAQCLQTMTLDFPDTKGLIQLPKRNYPSLQLSQTPKSGCQCYVYPSGTDAGALGKVFLASQWHNIPSCRQLI